MAMAGMTKVMSLNLIQANGMIQMAMAMAIIGLIQRSMIQDQMALDNGLKTRPISMLVQISEVIRPVIDSDAWIVMVMV